MTCDSSGLILQETTAPISNNNEDDDDFALPATANEEYIPISCRTPPRPESNNNSSKKRKLSN